MEVVRSSETSVSTFQTTRRDFPDDSHIHIRRSWYISTSFKSILYKITSMAVFTLKNSDHNLVQGEGRRLFVPIVLCSIFLLQAL
jgi:hypothetical protein